MYVSVLCLLLLIVVNDIQKNKGDAIMAEALKAMNPKGFGSFFSSKVRVGASV
jgi:hypothetical protein